MFPLWLLLALISSQTVNYSTATNTANKSRGGNGDEASKWLESAKASSILEEKGLPKNYYVSTRAVDGLAKTAWAEGKKGTGIGEWLELVFRQPLNIKKVKLIAGCGVSEKRWKQNQRLKTITLVFDDGTTQKASLSDSGFDQWSTVDTAHSQPTKSLRLIVNEVYSAKFQDACISEIEIVDSNSAKPEITSKNDNRNSKKNITLQCPRLFLGAAEPELEREEDYIPSEDDVYYEMVLIPGGSFRMGPNKKLVTIKPFCIGRTEVTARQYKVCAEGHFINIFDKCSVEGLSSDSSCTYNRSGTYNYRNDHPINCVIWKQAKYFCTAIDARLPSDAEWEWTARGGPANNPYPWGKTTPSNQLCWNGEGNDKGKGNRDDTCPVNSYLIDVTPQGVLGMGGNVSEWTAGRGKMKGEHSVRGGDYSEDEPQYCRVNYISSIGYPFGLPTIGFRCVVDPVQK